MTTANPENRRVSRTFSRNTKKKRSEHDDLDIPAQPTKKPSPDTEEPAVDALADVKQKNQAVASATETAEEDQKKDKVVEVVEINGRTYRIVRDLQRCQAIRTPNPKLADEIKAMDDSLNFKFSHTLFTVVDKIGEGTFSSVYRAVDEFGFIADNSNSSSASNVPEWYEPLAMTIETGTPYDEDKFKFTDTLGLDEAERPVLVAKRYVAIKRIYPTSSPLRQKTELDMLFRLGYPLLLYLHFIVNILCGS